MNQHGVASLSRRVRPRIHWVVLSVVLLVLAAMLLIEGYTQHMYGVSNDSVRQAPAPSDKVPAGVSGGGPVIDARTAKVRTVSVPDKTIVLTFDDGPDPVWTPKVLAVLREFHVAGTFFVVGTQVAAQPDLARLIVDGGNELGVHTFTHANLSTIPSWQRRLELKESQWAIAGAAGVSTALMRPPYSSENNAITNADWTVMRQIGRVGYLTVLTSRDSDDWRRPGVASIVRNATPPGHAGAVVLLHDAGGNRAQTIAALRLLIPQLRARGYQFKTVEQAFGLAAATAPASPTDRWLGKAWLWVLWLTRAMLQLLTWVLVISGVVSVLRAIAVVIAAWSHRRSLHGRKGEPITEPVTIVVPAYNEQAGIEASVRSLVASDHPVEVIVVDDGSTDETSAIVERLGLPGVRLIRQANGGKPSALNAGITAASHELIVMVDGDTVFEPDTVRQLVQPFGDPLVGAISGNAKVINRTGLLGRWQHIEYVVGFNLDRRLFDLAHCMPTVPGAIGAFRREALARVGGVSGETLAEDTDLTMALCRDGWRVVYEENARAWTEAPASIAALYRQRYRWCYGTLQSMWKHRGALFERGPGGKLGRRGIGYLMLFQVLLPLLAPAVDVFAIYGLIFLDPTRIALLWLGFLALQALISLYAFRLDGESPKPLWSLPLQQFVYRQLMYLVVIQSVFTAMTGARLRWQRMERYGSLKQPVS